LVRDYSLSVRIYLNLELGTLPKAFRVSNLSESCLPGVLIFEDAVCNRAFKSNPLLKTIDRYIPLDDADSELGMFSEL